MKSVQPANRRQNKVNQRPSGVVGQKRQFPNQTNFSSNEVIQDDQEVTEATINNRRQLKQASKHAPKSTNDIDLMINDNNSSNQNNKISNNHLIQVVGGGSTSNDWIQKKEQ